jgi:cytochrome P450
MDPPEHTRYRKLVSRAFTPRAMAGWEDLVREIVVGYLEPLVGESSFDLVGEVAGPFPVEVISAILGVPKDDRQQIRHWSDTMLRREEGESTGGAAAREAGIAKTMYFLELVAEKRRRPGDDMLSALIAAEVETDDGGTASLDDIEIAAFGTLLGAAGSETVTKLIGNAAVLFHRNPDQWRLVKEDPGLHADAVEEVLRYWPPSQYQGRCSAVESEWHGVTVPAGKPVFLLTGAATHDERAYEDPDRFDVQREHALAISLGHGVHSCLGAALARLESRVAIGEIAARLPDFTIDEAGCERVQMSNVAGYSKVPLHTGR